MPTALKQRLTEKETAFCQWLFTPGSETFGNGTRSARKAQYRGNDNVLATIAKENIRKPHIIAEKKRIQQETAKETGITRKRQMDRLDVLYDMAIDQKNPTSAKGIIAEQNEMLGYHRDKAPNQERLDETRRRMSAEDVLFCQEYALRRTLVLSRKQENENEV